MEAARLLDQLVSAHLIGALSPGRYAFPDLLRLYASERTAAEESPKERTTTASRLFHAYLATADAADRMVNPDRIRLPLTVDGHASSPPTRRLLAEFTDHAQGLAWLEAEHANLLTVVRHTADHGPHKIAWQLAHTFRGSLERGMYVVDWLTAVHAGLQAAKADGDLAGQAAAYPSLAAQLDRQGDLHAAADRNTRALECARQATWHEGEAIALAEIGVVHRHAGSLDEAAVYYREALEIAQQTETTSSSCNAYAISAIFTLRRENSPTRPTTTHKRYRSFVRSALMATRSSSPRISGSAIWCWSPGQRDRELPQGMGAEPCHRRPRPGLRQHAHTGHRPPRRRPLHLSAQALPKPRSPRAAQHVTGSMTRMR